VLLNLKGSDPEQVEENQQQGLTQGSPRKWQLK